VFQFHDNLYAGWRVQSGLVPILREEQEAPAERLLQAIWFHQRLRRDELRALDGRAVHVLHPGFWNREAGPDFRGAVIQFENEPPCVGDIEVDVRSSGWHWHAHDSNPNFVGVVLHVVWDGDATPSLPTIALKSLLDSPLDELALWLGSEAAQSFPMKLLGQCCSPLQELNQDRLSELLRQAAFIRFQAKAEQFQARARQAGWEQALWEGLFRALGYKQNVWPMQRLAELRGRLCPAGSRIELLMLQARLLGVGALLPDQIAGHSTTATYVRGLWDLWWRERASLCDCVLPRSIWRFNNLRPANHPQRRLALAAHWLAAERIPALAEKWCARALKETELVESLFEILHAPGDEFWSRHWTLRSRRTPTQQPLLGRTRVTDLAVNVVLPWLWIRAVEGRNEVLRKEMERRYYTWPSGEDNAVLRLARKRLLGEWWKRPLRGAAMQQGLLQVVRDFCEHSNALCSKCRFPDLVRSWPL
jgi:hypothetical protein